MPAENVEIEIDEHGAEIHPSFGWVQVNRVSVGPPGAPLFDSELLHREVVVLRVGRARRKRDLHRDWIHGDESIAELRMSMAQWGALVSSFGTSGVPATLERLNNEAVPPLPHSPRLALSTAEVENATSQLIGDLEDAVVALRGAHDTKAGRREVEAHLRDVEIRLGNARSNARFAANSFTEHVENVVTKARADIEATAMMAAERGLGAGDIAGILGPVQDDA